MLLFERSNTTSIGMINHSYWFVTLCNKVHLKTKLIGVNYMIYYVKLKKLRLFGRVTFNFSFLATKLCF